MSSATDLRVRTRRPGCAASLVRFASHHYPLGQKCWLDHGSRLLPVCEAQPVVSQGEIPDETSSSARCCIPSGVIRPFTSMRGGSNIDHSQRNVSDQAIQTGQGRVLQSIHQQFRSRSAGGYHAGLTVAASTSIRHLNKSRTLKNWLREQGILIAVLECTMDALQ